MALPFGEIGSSRSSRYRRSRATNCTGIIRRFWPVTRPKMKACTMTIHPGEFWIADIPFTDARSSKKRPVLALWLDGADVVVAAVTSAKPRSPRDVPLAEWKSSGLRLASTVRLSRLDGFEQSLLVARIGEISATDGQLALRAWAEHIKPRF